MFHTSNESATRKRLVTRVISLTSATALAVTTLVAIGVTPASADAAPVVKSFDYAVKLETPGSSVSIPNPVYKRIDFQARFNYDDVTSLRGHVITVDSAETGFTQANRPMVYAFFTFKDADSASIGNGSQINRVFSGQQLDNNNSITVPVNAVEMNINWTTAANISDSYSGSGPVAAGTYSSTPKIFDRGTVASPESPTEIAYTSDAESTAGLYYEADGSQANVEGIATNFNLPASGTIRRVHSTVVGCIDWSKVTSNTVANADFKVNGQAPDYSNVSTSDSANIYSGNPVNGSTLDFSTGDLATWRSQSKPIYVFAQYQEFDSSLITNGMAVDATLEVVDGSSVSILKDCTPSAPTGTGTLGAASMAGRLQFTPTTFVPPTGEWACNLYKKSDNALVATGSGWANSPCMIGSYGPDAPAIPTGVPLYAKPVSSIKILGQSFSAVGATASNEYTMTNSGGGSCPPVCGPPPMSFSYPSSLSVGSVAGSPSTLVPTISANQNLLASSIKMDSPSLIRSVPDGNGAYFYVGPNVTAPTKTDIVRLKTSGGADSAFGGSGSKGKIQVTTGTDEVSGFAWYSNKSRWIMTTRTAFNPNSPTPTSFKVISGATNSRTTVTKSMSNLNSICGTGFTAGFVSLMSFRSANPIAIVSCNNQSASKSVLISIAVATGNATKLTDLGSATMGKCVRTNRGVNPDATASTQQAALIYTTVGTCMMNPTVESRSVVAVTVGGRVSYNKTISTNPFGGTEPTQFIFGPGKAANTWLGSSSSFGENGPALGKLFTVSSTGTLKIGRVPVAPAANADWAFTDTIVPVKELSATKWLVVRMGYRQGIQVIAPATLNPSTGVLTTGRATKYTYMDAPTSRNILMFSMDASAKNMYFYAVTSSSKYSVAKWKLPTS